MDGVPWGWFSLYWVRPKRLSGEIFHKVNSTPHFVLFFFRDPSHQPAFKCLSDPTRVLCARNDWSTKVEPVRSCGYVVESDFHRVGTSGVRWKTFLWFISKQMNTRVFVKGQWCRSITARSRVYLSTSRPRVHSQDSESKGTSEILDAGI